MQLLNGQWELKLKFVACDGMKSWKMKDAGLVYVFHIPECVIAHTQLCKTFELESILTLNLIGKRHNFYQSDLV